VEALFPEGIAGRVLIDKLALHTPALPVIAKLFPRAKILFARRDPRDVVLSCFRRQFRMNPATYEFLTLEGAAAYYDQTMRLADRYRAKLPLDIRDVRNEDLVADFEGEIRDILQYIGLDWDPAIHGFPARARAFSTTPSAPQVARGINAGGIGQWRRYRRQLAPVLATLEPWAARFGYEPIPSEELPAAPDPRLDAVLPQIVAASRAGDWPRAFAGVDDAFARGLDHPLLHRLRGVRGQQEGRLDEAIADFEAALADAPGDASLLSALGLCLARSGRYVEALARLDTALALEPGLAAAHYNRGWALENSGDFSGARPAYERAVAIEPGHVTAIGALSSLAGRAGDWTGAREIARRALAIDPEQPVALTALAQAEAAQGEPVAAERRLRRLIDDSRRPSPHERALALAALGDALDRSERSADAFAAYLAAGEQFRSLYGARFGGPGVETSLATAKRLAGYFQAAESADWRRSPPPARPREARGHLFLIGFPRSGTTMLGQALAGHGDAVTLDERDTLGEAMRDFMGRPEDLARLAAIGPGDFDRYRALYWAKVAAAGVEATGKVFVDKQPMNTLALPLVVKLFPDAKVVLLRRDPRDVVLSAFRRQFTINATTVELMTPSGAAELYDAVMNLMEIYQEKLDLDWRVQGYEALVGDFDGETRALCGFAGLD
ncbi:MAG: sulfotransferase, partial [Caulobacteraceae bacterium]